MTNAHTEGVEAVPTGIEAVQWPGPALTEQLVELAGLGRGGPAPSTDTVVSWLAERLSDGVTAEQLCEAALWMGLRHTRVEGRGPHGLVSHAVLAAPSCRVIGSGDPLTTLLAAAQLVAYVVGDRYGGANDEREGPTRLERFVPSATVGDPVEAFLDAAIAGEVELSDHRWLAAAAHDPDAAVAALVSAGAGGYHLNEHKVIYPAQLLAWSGDGPIDPTVLRAAARFIGNHQQDPDHALSRRADAGVLAEITEFDPSALEEPDPARISTVATGLARTPTRELGPLLLGSLQDGLSPVDLVQAVALVTAARFADTSFAGRSPVGPLHACTGTNALRRCIAAASSAEAVFELALCAIESPSAARLAAIEELTVPPSDDGALEDLLGALDDGDPDAAADAASAVPPDDDDAIADAWGAVAAAAATDQVLLLHGVKHVVAMREDFQASSHPARIWFLAAAARTAAHAATGPSDVADAVRSRLLG